MSNKSSKFKASHILISSLVALIITFFVISDKIALLDNLAVLIAIWSIPVLILLITVIRDLILPKMNNETIKFKSKDTLITSLVALIITFFITADKIAQLDNLAVLMVIWSIPVTLLFFTVIRDLILHKT